MHSPLVSFHGSNLVILPDPFFSIYACSQLTQRGNQNQLNSILLKCLMMCLY
uniref:Uncharacterized protein n=1 Tax=Anguilla anguilla TaxID=7936 RepID=A0A0E9VDV8_ANGAN